jgi:adenosylcobinamide amidohydrolase
MILPNGETVEITEDTLIVGFPGRRSVISTSWLNGGYREDLTAVFNHQIPAVTSDYDHLATFEPVSYLERTAVGRRLDPGATAGLLTRAAMKNAAIVTESFREVSVSAIVTAGVNVNGCRAGDPASYYECNGTFVPLGGTINIILIVNAAIPGYAMVRAIMTATEAKSVALQQVMAKSCFSSGIATGSGTDMIAVVTDPGASLTLTDAGTHSKLGELIGTSITRATLDALHQETGLGPDLQRDVMERLSRYSITGEAVWSRAARMTSGIQKGPDRQHFLATLREWGRDPVSVALTAASLHIVDEVEWGLLSEDAAREFLEHIAESGRPGPSSGKRMSLEEGVEGFSKNREPLLTIIVDTIASRILGDRESIPFTTNPSRNGPGIREADPEDEHLVD